LSEAISKNTRSAARGFGSTRPEAISPVAFAGARPYLAGDRVGKDFLKHHNFVWKATARPPDKAPGAAADGTPVGAASLARYQPRPPSNGPAA
jgi:hypothetical protein